MTFSPDGTLFATCGKNDRLVKIWYEHKTSKCFFKNAFLNHLIDQILKFFLKDIFPAKSMDYQQSSSFAGYQKNSEAVDYSFIYIAHPRAVTNITWRKTSKHMPKGSVSNMIVTSCMDNICRIWVETILPDDGLVNMNQFDPLASQNPKFRTHRHKHRFMQRLKHMKTCFHIRRHAKGHGQVNNMSDSNAGDSIFEMGNSTIPTLPSTYSVHDFHSYGFNGTGVTPALHFHIAASINAETDIPLVPSLNGSKDPNYQPLFILHWLNNKEMYYTMQAEILLHESARKAFEKDFLTTSNADAQKADQKSETEETRKKLEKMGKSYSQDDSNNDDVQQTSNKSHSGGTGGAHSSNNHSLSNATSINSLAIEPTLHIPDSLDMKIECLLRDWHHSPDLLFSIHPVDGSFLIWLIEWLDEYHPGSFRQAQVSFSTRIPNAFPLGDALSMSSNVGLYSSGGSLLQFRDMVMKGVVCQTTELSESTAKLTSVVEETVDNSHNGDDAENDEEEDPKTKVGNTNKQKSPESGKIFLFNISFNVLHLN